MTPGQLCVTIHYMSRKVIIVLVIVIAGIHGTIYGQSAERVDTILAADPLSVEDAAYLAVVSAGLMGPEGEASEALSIIASRIAEREHRDRFDDRDADSPVSLGEFAYLMMLTHDITGGFWYRRVPGPRYAYREFAHRRLVQGQSFALQQMSGERAMRITGRVLAMQEPRS